MTTSGNATGTTTPGNTAPANGTFPTPGEWKIDDSHSEVGFAVRHMMVSKIRGRFRSFSGAVVVADDPTLSTVEITIDARSLDSGSEARDDAVRGADYLDVERHPVFTFRSTGIKRTGDEEFTLSGDLTVRDVTRPVELAAEYHGVARDPFGNDRMGFSAQGEISRKDFGIVTELPMDGGGVVVGDKIKLDLAVQFVRPAGTASAH